MRFATKNPPGVKHAANLRGGAACGKAGGWISTSGIKSTIDCPECLAIRFPDLSKQREAALRYWRDLEEAKARAKKNRIRSK